MDVLKIEKFEDGLGVVLPETMLDRLHLSEGDKLFIILTEDGVTLTPYDPEFETQMKFALEAMAKYRNTLRKLAE